jgi:hypothetical protein
MMRRSRVNQKLAETITTSHAAFHRSRGLTATSGSVTTSGGDATGGDTAGGDPVRSVRSADTTCALMTISYAIL